MSENVKREKEGGEETNREKKRYGASWNTVIKSIVDKGRERRRYTDIEKGNTR